METIYSGNRSNKQGFMRVVFSNIVFSVHSVLLHNIFFCNLPENKCYIHFPKWIETFSRTAEKYVNNRNAELVVILKALVSLQTYSVIEKVLSL
jgi:hypothetical protein